MTALAAASAPQDDSRLAAALRLTAAFDAAADIACYLDVFERPGSNRDAEVILRSWAGERDIAVEEHAIIGGGWDRAVTVRTRINSRITVYCAVRS